MRRPRLSRTSGTPPPPSAAAWRSDNTGRHDPVQQIGPRRSQASSFVAARSGEHAWQCLISPAAQRPPPLSPMRQVVAMEVLLERCAGLDVHQATVVYWKPVYAVLEGHFELIVGNAHHIKNVPGRKTDVRDAEWIAQLVRHGLVRQSFVPPPAIRDLRELVRCRRTLIETRTAMRNRVLKLLEGANIKLSGVAS